MLENLEETEESFRYFELPVVEDRGAVFRRTLDLGMRSGIRDEVTRGRTMTLFLDPADLRDRLEIETDQEIALLLLDDSGTIIWRSEGAYASDVEAELFDALNRL